ncbi:MAG TPA: DUF5715 family protein [Candidatus Limnocylindrales bacterium]|nr:DUF5715 family protein [Candidatus Limnocylindrales bacterium]
MTTTLLAEGGLKRSDLPFYHELPEDQQKALWDAAQPHFEAEMAYFSDYVRYGNLAEVGAGVDQGILVPVTEVPGRFGIARPVRDRYDLNDNRPGDEESVPYLHREAATVLEFLAEDFHCVSQRDDEFRETMESQGFSEARLSVYSMTRTTRYQRFIASQGRFAIGRDEKTKGLGSTHEKARAMDVDHSAFYAVRNDTGQEIALNRDADDKTFEALGKLLPRFKVLLRQVVTAYHDDGTVFAIEEVPNGWGGWHIAVKAA